MLTLLYALAAPITTIPLAVGAAGLVPWFRASVVLVAFCLVVCALKKKERIGRQFTANLLPLLVAWPVIGIAYTVCREKPQYTDYLPLVIWPYFLLVAGALWFTRKTIFLSLAAQSLLSIYALGSFYCCAMAISGKWI
ncbi:hypothetical protein Verru16b_03044 [Lacunisphaera limnophila]|uniref:Uncharacterized protein n=1 Tax=Lacunisphaera limnophila TaxID=1838286 RepID=A0A1D8AYH5_9BACT|nr:hypothetical protein [Lacunisphaera limnophila]AOS45953.1 hypothetical protein Verru16b_03044 [Lacunisphaera limnophila]